MVDTAHRIVVTGAGGFVGRALVRRLISDRPQAEILALGDAEALAAFPVRSCRVDVRSPELLDVIEEWRPDRIFHLAAKSSVAAAEADRLEAADVSIAGAMNLADAVRRFAPEAVVVFASSGEVYGKAFSIGDRLTEDSPVLPSNVYARAKLAAETVLTDRVGNAARVRIMRPLNHTGPGQDQRFIAPAFAHQIAQVEAGLIEPVVKVGNLDGARDFLDVEDVVSSYVAAADMALGRGAHVFNVSSDAPRSLSSLLEDLLGLSGVQVSIVVDPDRWRENTIQTTRLSSDRLREATGWRPSKEWIDTLSRLLQHSRDALKHSSSSN